MIEYQIDWRPGYRVYFGRDGDALVILLTGGHYNSDLNRVAHGRIASGWMPRRAETQCDSVHASPTVPMRRDAPDSKDSQRARGRPVVRQACCIERAPPSFQRRTRGLWHGIFGIRPPAFHVSRLASDARPCRSRSFHGFCRGTRSVGPWTFDRPRLAKTARGNTMGIRGRKQRGSSIPPQRRLLCFT